MNMAGISSIDFLAFLFSFNERWLSARAPFDIGIRVDVLWYQSVCKWIHSVVEGFYQWQLLESSAESYKEVSS